MIQPPPLPLASLKLPLQMEPAVLRPVPLRRPGGTEVDMRALLIIHAQRVPRVGMENPCRAFRQALDDTTPERVSTNEEGAFWKDLGRKVEEVG